MKHSNFINLKSVGFATAVVFGIGLLISSSPSVADQSVLQKGKNDWEDTKKDVRKGTRKAKKKVRDNTGNGSLKKDVEDKVDDIKDDVSTSRKKQ